MKKLDRNLLIDTEQCVAEAGGNRFNLVLIAAERLRELKKQNKDSLELMRPIDALLEIQAGKIDPEEYLEKIKNR